MVNVHKYDSYIIPRRKYICNWVVESIQSDMNDEFCVQIQIQSMSTTEVKLLSKFLRVMSISLQLNCFSIHTSEHQLFILIQLPPTVDKVYDIH